MCSTTTRTALEDIIIEKVNSGEIFSAFDVTLEGKRRGIQERHREVKHVVHEFFTANSMGPDYTRTLMNVGVPVQAFVYHPKTSDPSTYMPQPGKSNGHQSQHQKNQAKKANTFAATAQTVTPTAPAAPSVFSKQPSISLGNAPSSSNGNDSTAQTDARLTVCVPAGVMRRIGFNPGDEALVYADNTTKCVVIARSSQDAPSSYTKASKYTVDYHGNVRVTKKTLKFAGIDSGSKGEKFVVKDDGKTVTVSAA